ncbi:hypothetical protein KP509_1Z065200 [Ceratopteris richardii]|nr:hypothetical protein KP509_1Z065200 [Ceratopteris richardii]KAH6558419.1 hypothetical protein KP509_1Z065200 [Ceratopteris richardii]
MSGSAKRAHDEFNGSLPGSAVLPPSRQHDNEEHGLPMVTGDLASADRVPSPVDNVVEPRPTKLPRVDYGNRFQKRWGIDDPIAGTSSDGHDSKGDARDGGLKSSIEEKGSFGDIKMINHDDNGESGPWKAESGHDGNRNAHAERVNRNTGHSSSAGWQTDAWPWMDHRKYLSEVEGNWGIGRGWDDEKWEKDAGKAAISERTSRNNAWRRDQRFEAWGPPKDYKERSSVRTGSDLRDAPHWSKRVGVKTSTHEDGELKEYDEAALEMQADFKREEKECDQERKVKDDSFKDKEERDREERPARVWGSHASNVAELGWERWDRGKEVKEKGRDKKDQNHVEREEAGAIKQELEEIDASRRTGFDVSNITQQMELERKPSKESENIKGVDIDEKERRKERDREKKIEHERLVDRKLRDQEKAVEDMSHEDSERDKEAFVNHNFHQKRRMLRSRGPSQALSRDGRPRISSKDFDGNQGASEATSIIYRPGEHMPELTKLWKEYESSKNGEGMSLVQGPTIEIRIPAKLVTTQNHQVKGSQLWGTDVYTDDSDLVAVIMHTGYYRPSACQPPFSVQELRVTVRVLPPQDGYTSTLRNNIRSRAWGAASGCSFSVEQCKIMKVDHETFL